MEDGSPRSQTSTTKTRVPCGACGRLFLGVVGHRRPNKRLANTNLRPTLDVTVLGPMVGTWHTANDRAFSHTASNFMKIHVCFIYRGLIGTL